MQMAGALRVGGGRRQYSGKMDLNGIQCIHVAYLIRPRLGSHSFWGYFGSEHKDLGFDTATVSGRN